MKENDKRDIHVGRDAVSNPSIARAPDPHSGSNQKAHKANPGILDWLVDPLKGFFSPLTGILQSALKDLVSKTVFEDAKKDALNTPTTAKQALTKFFTPSSPLTPEEAGEKAVGLMLDSESAWSRLYSDTAGVEILGAGIVDLPAGLLSRHPHTAALLNIGTRMWEIEFEKALSPAFERLWLKQTQPNLPPYQDMISVYVREGYMEEKWVEIPPEMVEFFKELGFSEDWTKRLWGQHWVLPGVNLLYEMFHKKIIDYATMVQMLKYHDFEPVWRDRLIANAYTLIPRVDLRRGYAWGMIPEAELQDRYERLGYSVADATTMTGIAKRFGLSAYYSRLLTVACQAFRKGQLSGPAFQALMEVCGLPKEAQDILFEAELLARQIGAVEPGEEPRTLSASQVCGAYTKGLLSLSVARDRLLGMGYLEGDADLLLALAAPKPPAEAPSTEIVSAASLLYRNGWMSPEEFTGWLQKAKLSPEEITVTKDAQDLRFWFDYATDLLALLKEEYRKDVISKEEFYTDLLTWGCQPSRAWAIVSLEETRKIPKPKLAG